MPHPFGQDERVAAENDRDVMVPARKPPALIVIEAELALEILVRALGSPALHHHPYQLLLGQSLRERAEDVVGRLLLVVTPFDQQPYRFTLLDSIATVVGRDDAAKCKPGREVLLGSRAPGAPAKAAALLNPLCEIPNADDLFTPSTDLVKDHDDRPGIDGNGIVQAQVTDALAKLTGRSIGLIGEHKTGRDLVVDGALEQLQRERRFRGELHVRRDPRFLSTLSILGPGLREIQRKIDRELLCSRCHRQADADLAIRDLACGAGVLPLKLRPNVSPVSETLCRQ